MNQEWISFAAPTKAARGNNFGYIHPQISGMKARRAQDENQRGGFQTLYFLQRVRPSAQVTCKHPENRRVHDDACQRPCHGNTTRARRSLSRVQLVAVSIPNPLCNSVGTSNGCWWWGKNKYPSLPCALTPLFISHIALRLFLLVLITIVFESGSNQTTWDRERRKSSSDNQGDESNPPWHKKPTSKAVRRVARQRRESLTATKKKKNPRFFYLLCKNKFIKKNPQITTTPEYISWFM